MKDGRTDGRTDGQTDERGATPVIIVLFSGAAMMLPYPKMVQWGSKADFNFVAKSIKNGLKNISIYDPVSFYCEVDLHYPDDVKPKLRK